MVELEQSHLWSKGILFHCNHCGAAKQEFRLHGHSREVVRRLGFLIPSCRENDCASTHMAIDKWCPPRKVDIGAKEPRGGIDFQELVPASHKLMLSPVPAA